MSAEHAGLQAALGVANEAPGDWKAAVRHDCVTIERAKRAVACGAAGCTRGENLLLTRIQNFGKRVLCPTHALDLIEREISSEDGGER